MILSSFISATARFSTAPKKFSASNCTRRQLLYVLATPIAYSTLRQPVLARGLRVGEAEKAIPDEFPEEFPYVASDFARFDEQPDTYFYAYPRLLSHIDDGCIAALREYMANVMKPGESALDLAASYVNYFPSGIKAKGLGMNSEEMKANSALSDFRVKDLNVGDSMKFPFDNLEFDHVLCALSIDYITRPVMAIKECARVLKPGGKLFLAFSDRLFSSKAIALWTRSGDAEHVYAASCFIHFSGAFERPTVVDISPRGRFGGLLGDPLYVVSATRKS